MRRITHLDEEELERDAVDSAHVVLEMEDLDEVAVLRYCLVLRNTLGVELSKIVEVHDWVFSNRFTVESVRAGLVNPYPATLILARDVRLFDQSFDQVLDRSGLGNKQVELVLISLSAKSSQHNMRDSYLLRDSLTQPSQLDAFLCVQLSQSNLEDFEIKGVASLT